jgi:hypothetical protein
MSDYPMLISNKLHSFRNFAILNLISAAKQGNVYAKNKHNPPKDQKIISF